jgi:uncharacterized protein involved in exopolysaccharide biosynthesis
MGGVAGGLGTMVGRRDKVSQGIATLKSQQFIQEFIEANNLLPILYADRWDSKTSDWKASSFDEKPRLSDGYKKFDNTILRIVENSKSGLVAMTIEWTDPDLAAKWANNLTFRLNEKLRSRAIQEANQTIDFLNKEAEKTRIVELQQAIYFMIEEQINIRTMANIRQEYAFKVISPAIAPELDQYVSPKRILIFILGLFTGLMLATLVTCTVYALQHLRTELDN